MTSREEILKNIRKNKPVAKTLPKAFTVSNNSMSEGQLINLFKESLEKAGAEVIELKNEAELKLYIKNHCKGTVDLINPESKEKYSSNISKSRLEKTDSVIIPGQFGVLENGAIWLDESNFPNRLIPFVVKKLIININKKNILNNMHEAYSKIDLKNTGFGIFISGPSKTADIEQSLVYGAHGAKELVVIIY